MVAIVFDKELKFAIQKTIESYLKSIKDPNPFKFCRDEGEVEEWRLHYKYELDGFRHALSVLGINETEWVFYDTDEIKED